MLSDLIVIWRAWVLFPDQLWVTLVPFVLWTGTVGNGHSVWKSLPFAELLYTLPGTTVASLAFLLTPIGYDSSKRGTGITLFIWTASVALSIATNAVTTFMIAYKLWHVAVGIERPGSNGSPWGL